MRRPWPFIVFAAALAVTVAAGDDPASPCVAALRAEVAAIGRPRATEVAAELDAVASLLPDLDRRVRNAASERAALDSEQSLFDFHARDRDDNLKAIARDQETCDRDAQDLHERITTHNQDADAQHACAAAAATEAQAAACQAWKEVVDVRAAGLRREQSELADRVAEIEARRAAIESGIAEDAWRFRTLQTRRAHLDQETGGILGECSAARSRALAIRQIADAPERPAPYQPPNAVADKVVGDLFKSFVKEGALRGLEGQVMMKALAKIGLRASPVGTAYTIADIFADVAIAGVDRRNVEVEKNLLLIGDYGRVMRQMVQSKPNATSDPAYQAMLAELERQRGDMPTTNWQMIGQGLMSAEAVAEGLAAAAGQYASRAATHALGDAVKRMDPKDIETLGEAGARFFADALGGTTSVGADETAKAGTRAITEALQEARERRNGSTTEPPEKRP